MSRRRHRSDLNQKPIVKDARALGISIFITSQLGDGFPDAVAGFRGVNYLVEIKDEDGVLTPAEQKFFDEWLGQATIIRTLDDLLELVGAV